ncbi:MAG: GNAT family N-acetyltransferase [Tetrasphaera sp.]
MPSLSAGTLRIVPAGEAKWDNLQRIFGARGSAAMCQCQRYKLPAGEAFKDVPAAEREHRLRMQTQGETEESTGLVTYLGEQPVGWCAVQPRAAYGGLVRGQRVPWDGREEDKADPTVWAVTCFVTRTGYRRQGIASALALAAVEHAHRLGARAIEGYPINTTAAILAEMHVGTIGMFLRAGLAEVARPTKRRVVMRREF